MTLRCALYARYSSDQQRAASMEEQFRVCREHAGREGWRVEVVGCTKVSTLTSAEVCATGGPTATRRSSTI